MSSNPVRDLNFLSGLISTTSSVVFIAMNLMHILLREYIIEHHSENFTGFLEPNRQIFFQGMLIPYKMFMSIKGFL